jgi:hypothetical protein
VGYAGLYSGCLAWASPFTFEQNYHLIMNYIF